MSETARRSRAPIDTAGGRPPTAVEFATARRIVSSSGVLGPLQAQLDYKVGRHRSLSVEGLLVAMQINALRRYHLATVAEFARVLNSATDRQRATLGIKKWKPEQAYDRADQLFNSLSRALEQGWDAVVAGAGVHIDVAWFADRLIHASLVDVPVWSKSVAVDGTDIETWARKPQWVDEVDFEGAPDDRGKEAPKPAKPRSKKPPTPAYGYDADGTPIFTKDRDARWGHRSATSSRSSGSYVGYEAHTVVLARDAGWSDGIERLTLGPDVPPIITMFSLVPASSRCDDAIVPRLIAAKEAGLDINDVLWDRGYSQLLPENTSHPLNRVGIGQTFRPKDPQRVRKPFRDDALLIEGHLVNAHVPKELQGLLPMPPMGATAAECAKYEEAFNRLAQFRFERHAGPDADGATRWRCPFCAGRLRSRQLPATMRGSRNAPLVSLPIGTSCCDGIVTASAEELPHWQRFLPGTTAWRTSYGRRQVVEGVNAMLKGGFVNIQHKFMRVFGLTKMTLMLAFTVVGYNLERIRSFLTKQVVEKAASAVKKPRKRRRTGTWVDVISSGRPGSGRAPPPT